MNKSANLYPKIWGGKMWESLHSITFGYPENPTKEDKYHYKRFFEEVGFVLPCSTCQESYQSFIKTDNTILDDYVLSSRDTLTKWLYDVHNRVNKKLDVVYDISYEDVVKKYESYRAVCDNPYSIDCIIPLKKKALSFQMADNKECPFITLKIAQCFVNYANERGVKDIKTISFWNHVRQEKDCELWKFRNKECCYIIEKMRLRGISPVETEGKYKGLPSVYELKLISRLSTSLKISELNKIIEKIGCN